MPLDDQITQRSKEISTDSYAMSVGELLSLYRDKELNIHPEFQRFFRWSDEQKSRLIESLLLGIPIPPIFVSQDEKGKWDVIDGLQRLSTIFQLTGDLKDENDGPVLPLILQETKYLSDLKAKRWKGAQENDPNELSETAKLIIKRARLDLKIVLNKSDPSSKYELFDRLNTGGSAATDQEVRNCLLIMINKDFFGWVSSLSDDANFKTCIPLSERQLQEQFNLELLVRFLTLRTAPFEDLKGMTDLGPFLTQKITALAQNKEYNRQEEETAFRRTFELLNDALGEDSFRKYNAEKQAPSGALLISVFEVLALGIGYNVLAPNYSLTADQIREVHKSVWQTKKFTDGTGSGIRPTSRIPVTIPLGRLLFKP
jgi:hypothetical protein